MGVMELEDAYLVSFSTDTESFGILDQRGKTSLAQ